MNTRTAVRHISFGSPGRYLQGPNILWKLAGLLSEFCALRPVIVADPTVRELLCASEPALQDVPWHTFGGECTAAEVQRIVDRCRIHGCNLIVGAGGGKSIDAAKAAQIALGCRVFIVPTVASTDAPTSRVAVIYTDDHRLEEVRHMRTNPDVVLVDSALLVKAPRRYFVSGLGDALSKKFEVAQCVAAGGLNFYGGRQSGLATLIADRCFDTLMADTEAALQAIETGQTNAAFERTLEATILLSGLAFENGGLSIAHSLTRGLSAVPAIQGCLHGEEVAFGLLVQLQLESDAMQPVLRQLLPYYRLAGLPTSLQALGVPAAETAAAARHIAGLTITTSPHIHHFPRPLSCDELTRAILDVALLD